MTAYYVGDKDQSTNFFSLTNGNKMTTLWFVGTDISVIH